MVCKKIQVNACKPLKFMHKALICIGVPLFFIDDVNCSKLLSFIYLPLNTSICLFSHLLHKIRCNITYLDILCSSTNKSPFQNCLLFFLIFNFQWAQFRGFTSVALGGNLSSGTTHKKLSVTNCVHAFCLLLKPNTCEYLGHTTLNIISK